MKPTVVLCALLRDPAATLDRDALFFHYPHSYETTTPVSGVRMRDWKLLEYLEDGRLELYNLRDDPSEAVDVAGRDPGQADSMRRRLQDWRTAVDAAMPTPNPDSKVKK
jgi:arylsulfatase A-like enzyme